MSAGKILSRVWMIVRTHKLLWLLGLFAGWGSWIYVRQQILSRGTWFSLHAGGSARQAALSHLPRISLAAGLWLVAMVARVNLVQLVIELHQSSGRQSRRKRKSRRRQSAAQALTFWARLRQSCRPLPKILAIEVAFGVPLVLYAALEYLPQRSLQSPSAGSHSLYGGISSFLSLGLGLLSLGILLIEPLAFRAIAIDNASPANSVKLALKAVKGNLGRILGVWVAAGLVITASAFLALVFLSPILLKLLIPRVIALQDCMVSYGMDLDTKALQDCWAQFLASPGLFNDWTLYGLGILVSIPSCIGSAYVGAASTLLYEVVADKSILNPRLQ